MVLHRHTSRLPNHVYKLLIPGKPLPPRTVSFRVPIDSNKVMIKHYVEALYGVRVKKVSARKGWRGWDGRWGGRSGRRSDVLFPRPPRALAANPPFSGAHPHQQRKGGGEEAAVQAAEVPQDFRLEEGVRCAARRPPGRRDPQAGHQVTKQLWKGKERELPPLPGGASGSARGIHVDRSVLLGPAPRRALLVPGKLCARPGARRRARGRNAMVRTLITAR